jgi:hypothetical protein
MRIIDLVQDQIIEEFGEEWEDRDIEPERMKMVAMKYGVRIPELTQSELYLIHREYLQERGQWKQNKKDQQRQL